jgi:large subunit ribosomal protein L18
LPLTYRKEWNVLINKASSNVARLSRHKRVRKDISGTAERPRLCVFRSSKNIYAQIIDDVAGNTLVSASSLEAGFEGNGGNKEAAKNVGIAVAKKALDKGITEVVFDRGGYVYHGRVKELADGAREGGLKF